MPQRGTLVDRCDRCGAWLRKMTAEQHSAATMIYVDLAAQLDWPRGSGRMLTKEQWKRLMVAAYERTQGNEAEAFPALDGQGVDVVYRRQSRLTQGEGSELIEFAKAWAVEAGVTLHEPEPA